MSVTVRDATAAESTLLKRAVLEAGTYTGPDHCALLPAVVESTSLKQVSARVVTVAGQIAGSCGVLLPDRVDTDEAELDFLLVQERWRGRGLGATLLADARDLAGRAGAVRIRVVAHPALERFYLGAGARRIGTEPPRPNHSWYCPVLALTTQAEALSSV